MTVAKTYKCRCGIERREVNHWFVYTRSGAGLEFHRWNWVGREELENLFPDETEFGHLCGQQCAHKLLDEFLNERPTEEKGEDDADVDG